MRLVLGPKQFVWALVEPMARNYIKDTDGELGYQPINLIITQKDLKPVEIELSEWPAWAQKQINTSVSSGQLIDLDAKIRESKPEVAAEESKGKSSKKK